MNQNQHNSSRLNLQLRCAGDTGDGLAIQAHHPWASLTMWKLAWSWANGCQGHMGRWTPPLFGSAVFCLWPSGKYTESCCVFACVRWSWNMCALIKNTTPLKPPLKKLSKWNSENRYCENHVGTIIKTHKQHITQPLQTVVRTQSCKIK